MANPETIKLETGAQLLARLTKKPTLEHFYPALFASGPKQGATVEIYSNESMCLLLNDIISEVLIPTQFGGREAGVVFISTDGNFSFDVLVNVIKRKITTRMSEQAVYIEETSSILLKVVSNFLLLEVYDAEQFYTTLHNLDNILVDHSNVSLIVVDTVTAFYWSEQGFKITKMDIYLKKIIQMIQKVTKDFKTTIFYTRPEYFISVKDNSENSMDNPLQDYLAYQLKLSTIDNKCYLVNLKSSGQSSQKIFSLNDSCIVWI